MQLIGKLMRSADSSRARRRRERQLGRARDALALHQAERWRAELIADDEATTRFAAATPAPTCSSCARSCATRARTPRAMPEQRSGRAYRELFQFIREHERRACGATNVPAMRMATRLHSMTDLAGASDRSASASSRSATAPRRRVRGQGPAGAADWLGRALRNPINWETRLIPDERATIIARPCASWSTKKAATWC
jgi:hypothetical protein